MDQLLVSSRMLGLFAYVPEHFLFGQHGSFTVTPPKREWFFPLSVMPDIRSASRTGIITRILMICCCPAGQQESSQSSANPAVLEFGAGNPDLATYVPLTGRPPRPGSAF